MHQGFVNVLGGNIRMSCFGMLDCLLQFLDGVRHMLMLFGVLFLRRLSMGQALFRVLEQHFCVTVLAMCLCHCGMFDRLSGVMIGNRRGRQQNAQNTDGKTCWYVSHDITSTKSIEINFTASNRALQRIYRYSDLYYAETHLWKYRSASHLFLPR